MFLPWSHMAVAAVVAVTFVLFALFGKKSGDWGLLGIAAVLCGFVFLGLQIAALL